MQLTPPPTHTCRTGWKQPLRYEWERGMWAAYQVCLDSGDYILAPNDDDYCIRAQKPRHRVLNKGLVFTGTTHTLLFTRAPKGWAQLSLRSLSAFALVSSSLSTAWA
jgi:hypothetical protein